MKVVLIIAHNCILPGAYKGFEEVLDRLHHEMPGTRVTSTSLSDLENDLRTLLREDVESVTLLPYLLLNGRHSRSDVPRTVAKLQGEFPHIPITLLPCLGDFPGFAEMVVQGMLDCDSLVKLGNPESSPEPTTPSKQPSEGNPQAENSKLFAVEMNLEGRNVLVVGGGRIALRKVKTLLPTGARITVVAPQFDPEFLQLAQSVSAQSSLSSLVLKERPYETLDLRSASLVFICTDQPTVNAQVSNDARARRILVNNACDYLDGDFIVPARMDFGQNIAVTVSTQGKSPSLAKKLKQKIQTDWAEELKQMEEEFRRDEV